MNIMKKNSSRREFVQGIATGAIGLAAAGHFSGAALLAVQQAPAGYINPQGARQKPQAKYRMDLNAFSASFYSGMDVISQYSAPMCYELCGKTFIVMRGANHKNNATPGVTFAAYPEKTVTLDSRTLPYCAAKIADNLVFAAFHAGSEAYACVFDPSKNVAPGQLSKSESLSAALYVDTAENPLRSGFAFNGPGVPNAETDFTGNIVEWTFAPGVSAKFDYTAKNVSGNMPGGIPPFSANFARVETMRLADGVYLQGIQASMFNNPGWIILAMNFNKVRAAGAAFGSTPGAAFMRQVGGYGKILNS
jgi:hypothetical protein